MVYFQRWQRGLVLAVLSALAFSNSTGKMMEKTAAIVNTVGTYNPV